MIKGKFFLKAVLGASVICAASPLAFSAPKADSDRIHWTEFKEVYDRINDTTDKAKKVVEGIVKYLNAKHQLVYENDEYVDRFIIDGATYARLNDDVKMTDESVLVISNSSAIYGYDWPFEDYDNNLLEIQDKAIVHNFGGLGGVKAVNDDKGYFDKMAVDPSANVKYKKINITSTKGVGNGLFNYNAVNVSSIEMKGSETSLSGLSGGRIKTSDIGTITYDNIAGSVENGAFLVNMNDDLVDKIGEWYVGNYPMDPVLNGYIMGTVNLNGGAVLMNVANVYIADPSKSTSGLDKPYIEKVVGNSGVNLIYNSGEIGEVSLASGVILNDSAELANSTDSSAHTVSGHIGRVVLLDTSAVLVNNENAVVDELVGKSLGHTVHNKGVIKKWDFIGYDNTILGYGAGRLELESEITNRTQIEDSIINVKNGGVFHNDSEILNNKIVVDAGGAFYDAFEINDEGNATTGHAIQGGSIINGGIFHTKYQIGVDLIENLEGGVFTATQENLAWTMHADKISNSGTMLFQNSSTVSGGKQLYINTFENKAGTATIQHGFTPEIGRLNVLGGEVETDCNVYISKGVNVGDGGVLTVNASLDFYDSVKNSMETWTSSGTINLEEGSSIRVVKLENSGLINLNGSVDFKAGDIYNLEGGRIVFNSNLSYLMDTLRIFNHGELEIKPGGHASYFCIYNYASVNNNNGYLSGSTFNYGTIIHNTPIDVDDNYGSVFNLESGIFINNGVIKLSGSLSPYPAIDEDGNRRIVFENVNYGRWEQGENAVIKVYNTDQVTNKGTFVNKSLAGDDSAFKFDVLYNDGTFENIGSYKKQFVNNENGTLINSGNFAPTALTNDGLIKNSGTIELLAENIKLGKVETGGANASVILPDGKSTTLTDTKLNGGSLIVGDSAVLNLGDGVDVKNSTVLNFSKSSVLNIGTGADVHAGLDSSLYGDINISINGNLSVLSDNLGEGSDILNGGHLYLEGGILNRRIVSSSEYDSIYIVGNVVSNADISATVLYFGAAEGENISTLSLAEGAKLDVDYIHLHTDYDIAFSVGEELILIDGLSETIALSGIDLGRQFDNYIEGEDYTIINEAGRFGIRFNSAIPEPATYAAVFGALALAFAAYRRIK